MTQDELLNKLLAEVVDLKESFKEFRDVGIKEELQVVKSDLMTHIDGFIKLHETLSLELTSMRAKNERLEERLQRVELKLGIVNA